MRNLLLPEPVLVVDIGNSHIVCAIFLKGKSVWTARLTSFKENTSDEYYVLLSKLLESTTQYLIQRVDISLTDFLLKTRPSSYYDT